MSNPMTMAREEAGAALASLGCPVSISLGGSSGPAGVHLIAGTTDSRGRVEVIVTISAPLAAADKAVTDVEQLSWDVREAVAAAGMGWLSISEPRVDTEAQRLLRTITVTTRP